MRTIKFRIWADTDNGTEMLYLDKGEFDNGIWFEAPIHVDEHHNAMQFIGLTDKNGVEIYEGDYLVDRFPVDEEDLTKGYNESLLPVVWCEKQLMWCVDASFAKDGSYLTSLVEYFGEFLEVKGNIHERS